jgi:hypothetical protein
MKRLRRPGNILVAVVVFACSVGLSAGLSAGFSVVMAIFFLNTPFTFDFRRENELSAANGLD